MTNSAELQRTVGDDGVTATRIGARVRRIRTDAGWSTREFAVRVGLAMPVVSDIEQGRRLPTVELLYRLAFSLQVAPGELLPAAEERPRVDVVLPVTDGHDAPTTRIIGGGPGHPTQTYLYDLPAGQDDGGFGAHPGDELLVVMEGEVVCSTLGSPDLVIRAGQSHMVETDLPHGLRAGDGGPARFLLVCTDACEG